MQYPKKSNQKIETLLKSNLSHKAKTLAIGVLSGVFKFLKSVDLRGNNTPEHFGKKLIWRVLRHLRDEGLLVSKQLRIAGKFAGIEYYLTGNVKIDSDLVTPYVEAWNQIANDSNGVFTPIRQEAIDTGVFDIAVREFTKAGGDLEQYKTANKELLTIPYFRGEGSKGTFKLHFSFILQPEKYYKWLKGEYRDKNSNKKPQTSNIKPVLAPVSDVFTIRKGVINSTLKAILNKEHLYPSKQSVFARVKEHIARYGEGETLKRLRGVSWFMELIALPETL